MKASVIVPSWNGKKLLEICLPSLIRQTFKDFEVIVVDNGSVDGSVEYVKDNFPKFRLIELSQNLGFAPAVNIGINKAKGEYLILINNDTEVDTRCVEYLIRAAGEKKEVGMVGAKMLNFYKRDIVDSAGDYLDSVGHASNIGLGERDGEKFQKSGYVFLVTGGGSLFKREMLDKVGLFDDSYFAYFEDIDLCMRAQLLGFKAWFEAKAIIYHIHKATSSKNRQFLEYLQFRNMMITIIKDFPTKLLLKNLNFIKIILVNINTIRYLAFKGFLLSALKAEAYIWLNLPNLIKKRIQIQGSKIVSDDYIIENVINKRITFFKLFKGGI